MPFKDFGNFIDGTIGSEIRDTSWNWDSGVTGSPPHVKVAALVGGGLNGGNAVRCITDDTMQFANQGARVRIHGIGIKGGDPWVDTDQIVRVVALRVASGANFTNPEKVTTEELHGPNGAGAVINTAVFGRSGADKFWRHYIRGNSVINNTYAFQWIFGPNDSSPVGPNNNHQDWVGGNKPVVFDEWIVHVMSFKLSAGAFTGSFQAWYWVPGMADLVECVPKKTGMSVGYPTQNGPYMSVYYGAGSGGQNQVDYCGGRYYYGDTEANLIAAAQSYARTRFAIGAGTPGGGGSDPTLDAEPSGWLGGAYAFTGTTQHGSQVDKQRCTRLVVAKAGTVAAIGTYREPAGAIGTELVQFAVWADNAGEPGALLGKTAEVQLTNLTPAGRISAPLATTPFAVTVGQVVWIGDITGGAASIAVARQNVVVAAFRLMTAAYAGGPVAWDPVNDAGFDIELVEWLSGSSGGGTAPQNVVAPVVSGANRVGKQLACSQGTWTGTPTGFAYQWQRDVAGNGVFSNIAAATAQTYVLTDSDRDCQVRCRVTASNALGSGTGDSSPVAPVRAPTVGSALRSRTFVLGGAWGTQSSEAVVTGIVVPGVRPVLDSFVIDGALPAGWAGDTVDMRIVNGALKNTGVAGSMRRVYRTTVYGPDSEVYCTLGVEDKALGLLVRYDPATGNGYALYHTEVPNTADYFEVWKIGAGAAIIGARSFYDAIPGDKIFFTAVGTKLTGWVKKIGRSDIEEVIVVTDATYAGANRIGVEINDTLRAIDDVGGGTVGTTKVRDMPMWLPFPEPVITAKSTGIHRGTFANPGTTPAGTVGTAFIRARAVSGSGVLRVTIYQGATQKSTQDFTLTNTLQTFSLALTAITDFTTLEYSVEGINASGGSLTAEVADVWVDIPS